MNTSYEGTSREFDIDNKKRERYISSRAKILLSIIMMFLVGVYLYNYNTDSRANDLKQYYSGLLPEVSINCQCSDSRCICTNSRIDLPESELLKRAKEPFMSSDSDEVTFVAIEKEGKCMEVVGGITVNKDGSCIDESLRSHDPKGDGVDFGKIKDKFRQEMEFWRKYFAQKVTEQENQLRGFLKGIQN